ncbi:alpha-L-arabinofuranosidase C-terminal domain-containing protein [Pseudothermotoga thermarum]|uniref:non-reducing end alpha-L-arabinofuranosidase n=1 Tax=Pseudothermotoga thermarum DSM 5069 TaxID=688269 RepID=F7YTI4_9THEM|nr:alpha-L-arabinofuranosidase C-terminal domain-containing protein [Pseudothermotoga thermarum]AEH51198.1 alpha-L-arabinofuranosidase domain protein [Pseudothermotoga thermarum DSM 5069]
MRKWAFLIAIILLINTLSFTVDHVLTFEMSLIHAIPQTLFGIFFEDINHAVDGGLYAELIRNGSFEHIFSLEGWALELCEESIEVSVDTSNPIHPNNKNYVRVRSDDPNAEIVLINLGYTASPIRGGIPIKAGEAYNLSFFVRTVGFTGEVSVYLENRRGEKYAESLVRISEQIDDWMRISLELVPKVTFSNSHFVMRIKGQGELHLDMISLIPKNTWHNMRTDLINVLKDLKPGFFRFPGGCLVEGDSLSNAYRWKDTIGPIEERKPNRNLWGYHQSYGIGFYEYLLLAEYLGAEPVPIFNAGISCQVRGAEYCPVDELDEWIQDVLDFLEFANGPTDTYWGSIRAQLGHPETFNVKYIGIGNENWGDQYHERFKLFHTAIKEKYPEVKIVFSGPPSYEGSNFRYAMRWAKENDVEIFDEHIYASPEWLLANTERYDRYDRTGPRIMLGEYAAHAPGRQNNWQAALAEAAFLTGVVRNSDVVIMASYAPLFNRIGFSQWVPDLIWFDSASFFLTPSYFVQKLYADHTGDYLIPSEITNEDLVLIGYRYKAIYHVCTYNSKSNEITVFLVNPWPDDKSVKIQLPENIRTRKEINLIRLCGSLTDINNFDDYAIVPVHEKIISNSCGSFDFIAKGYSFNVLKIGLE